MVSRAFKFVAWLATVEAVGFVAAALGGLVGKNPWFDELPKPRRWPPTLIFPLAWSLVNYPSLALATWRRWTMRGTSNVAPQLAVFSVVMLLNVEFGFVVNRAKRTDVYVLMDMLGVGTAFALFMAFRSTDRRAGTFALPYLGWSIYTTALKIALHRHQET